METTDSNQKIKIGVVGVGVLGRHHTRLYKEIENVELVGIYDALPEAANRVGEEFGVKVFPAYEDLVMKCDALSIAVPATMHHAIAMPIINMGKHVLIEKPLAAAIDEAEEMVRVAKEKNLVMGVGHVERFNPAMHYLEKRSGKTRFVEAHRLAPYPPPREGQHRRGTEVGVILDLMIHDIDLVLTMVDSEVDHIDAVGIPILSKTEDLASVRLRFKNGTVANLTASRVSESPMRRFRVFQNDAYISMDYSSHQGKIFQKGIMGIKNKLVELDATNALKEELENFVNAVKMTKETGILHQPKVSGEQGLKALKLAITITEEVNSYNKKYGIEYA